MITQNANKDALALNMETGKMQEKHNSKKETIQKIIDDAFNVSESKMDRNNRDKIENFITSTVNGDMPEAHLIINANLNENDKGTIIFILTDIRLIKIDISKEIQSHSFPLKTLTGINRKLLDDGRAEFSVSFQNGAFGLRYPQEDNNITDFFQKIDSVRNA